MSYWVTAYLALGSNVSAERSLEDNLREACWELTEHPGLQIVATSSIYRSKPWGELEQNDFLNAVIGIETLLSPRELLEHVKNVERVMGRVPTYRWGPRIIDIDILLYANLEIIEPDLVIPHAHLLERPFVFIPLLEIVPEVRLPDGRMLRSLVKWDAVYYPDLVRVGPLARRGSSK
jgi:2-amino-4-hydroxy-6-hydroxymethyldihydropteridine diphosphokinase